MCGRRGVRLRVGKARMLDQRKKQAILDAATAAFVERGYKKTSIDDVAAAAGVGKGNIASGRLNKVFEPSFINVEELYPLPKHSHVFISSPSLVNVCS